MPGWRAVGPSISFVASWSQEGWEGARAHSDSTAYEMCNPDTLGNLLYLVPPQ